MSELLAGLDIGTSRVTCVAAEFEAGCVSAPSIIGAGQASLEGAVREGVLLDISTAARAVEKAVEEAELLCESEIRGVIVSVSGAHVRGFDGIGTVGVERAEGEGPRGITADDIARAEEAARSVRLPQGCRVLDIVKRDYCVDGFDRLRRPPVGLLAEQVSARIYTVIADRTAVANIEAAVAAAGLEVEAVVPSAEASGASVLTPDEMEMGVAVADMGAGTTDVAVFMNGSLAHLGVVPLGGNSITADLQSLRIPWEQAERLKTEWAVAAYGLVDPNQSLKISRLGGRGTFSISHSVASQVVGQRVEEIFEAISMEISRSNIDLTELPGGLILTGGSSRLRGIAEVASRTTGLPVEIGVPTGFATSTELVLTPEFATATGLVTIGWARRSQEPPGRPGMLSGFFRWLSGMAGKLR